MLSTGYVTGSSVLRADTRVSNLDVLLRIALDGSLLVQETIQTEANATHSPLFRDLDTRLPWRDADAPPYEVEVLHVEHSDRRLPWQEEVRPNGLRVHLGSPKRKVLRGRHSYELLYHVRNALSVDEDRAILVWRPLGAGTATAVDGLTVRITFPRRMAEKDIRVFSGATDSGFQPDWRIGADGTTVLSWSSVQPKAAVPAFAISWPGGVLLPQSGDKTTHWLRPKITPLWWMGVGLGLTLLLIPLVRIHAIKRAPALWLVMAAFVALGYTAGTHTALYPGTFNAGYILALIAAAYVPWANRWVYGLPWVHIAASAVLVLIPTFLLAHAVSPWYPALFLGYIDGLLVFMRKTAPARLSGDAHRATDGLSTQKKSDTQTPVRSGRHTPYFDRRPSDNTPGHTHSGRLEPRLNPLRDADTHP